MQEFECTDAAILVRRGAVDAFLAAFGPFKGRGEKVVLRSFGMESFPTDPEATFSLAAFLHAMRELQNQFGPPFMRKIGSFIYDNAVFQPGLDTLEKLMAGTDVAYNMNHVNGAGRIGSYQWTRTGERQGVMSCDSPYPCAFDLGILESVAARFEKEGRVKHVEGPCRKQQGDECSYIVEW
jgi:hypothetical protein